MKWVSVFGSADRRVMLSARLKSKFGSALAIAPENVNYELIQYAVPALALPTLD